VRHLAGESETLARPQAHPWLLIAPTSMVVGRTERSFDVSAQLADSSASVAPRN
jgi:hypothetical protein